MFTSKTDTAYAWPEFLLYFIYVNINEKNIAVIQASGFSLETLRAQTKRVLNHAERAGCYLHQLGCYNKVPQTGWLVNNGHLFLTVQEVGSPISKHQQIQCLVKAFFLIGCADSLCSHMVEAQKGSLRPLLEGH